MSGTAGLGTSKDSQIEATASAGRYSTSLIVVSLDLSID